MHKHTVFALPLALIANTVTQAATLPAAEDSFSYRAKLTTAANKAATLPVDAAHRAFIYFDLAGGLPAGTQIRYARLRLYLPKVVRTGGGLNVHRVTGSWDESLASAEPSVDAALLATIGASGIGTKRFVSVDVTATVQGWITTPASNEGFAISAVPGTSAALTGSMAIGAKEGAGSGYPAELDVEIADDPIGPGAVGSVQLAANAVTASILADSSVTSAKIASGAVTDAKIAAVSGSKVSGPVASATTALSALTAGNANTVNGIGASATPTPNTLLALDGGGKIPGSVVSFGSGGGFDADLLDSFDSTAFIKKGGDTATGPINLTNIANTLTGRFTASGDADMQGNILKTPVIGMLLHNAAFASGSGSYSGSGNSTQFTGTGIAVQNRSGSFLSCRAVWGATGLASPNHFARVMVGTNAGGFGFVATGGSLKGVTAVGVPAAQRTEVDLATPLDQAMSLLAVRRGNAVDFYVDGVLKGTASGNIVPTFEGGSIETVWDQIGQNPLVVVSMFTIGAPMF